MRHRWRGLYAPVALCCLASLLGCASGSGGDADPATAPERSQLPPGFVVANTTHLTVEEVRLEPWQPAVTAPARVTLEEGSLNAVSSPVDGRVSTVHAVIGQRVEAGDELASIVSAEAASARAGMRAAEARLRAARDRVERQERLMQSGAGIERELVTARNELAEARVELERSRLEVRTIGDGRGTEVVVRAPAAGVVLRRNVAIGSSVSMDGEPMFEIGDLDRLWFVADVYERDLVLLGEGSRVIIDRLPGGQEVEGEVVLIGASFESTMRRAPVYVAPTAPLDGALRPGMTGRARLLLEPDDTIRVPTRSVLIKDGRHTVVYVEREPGLFEARPVTLGRQSNGHVQILDGLVAGERVVTRGALLVDGEADMQL